MAVGTLVVWLLLPLASAALRTVGERCQTPDGRSGSCIILKYCPELLSLLKRNPNKETVTFLQQATCGFEGMSPIICCPQVPNLEYVERFPNVSNNPKLRLLPTENCGQSSENRIFGGNVTSLYEYPWMALLGFNKTDRFIGYLCGGTVISEKYVLTAAHCILVDNGKKLTTVRIGEYNTKTDEDCEENEIGKLMCAPPVQEFGIESAIGHPGFSLEKLQNDVGLIRVKGRIKFTIAVKPICLPVEQDQASTNFSKMIVAGWGVTETASQSPVLLRVNLPLVSNARCAEVYKKNNVAITNNQICAGGSNGRDSCAGDSGGPLMHLDDVKMVQFGIVSFGPKPCAIEGSPGVYTKVMAYMDWILENMHD